jgi:hypothetical protein
LERGGREGGCDERLSSTIKGYKLARKINKQRGENKQPAVPGTQKQNKPKPMHIFRPLPLPLYGFVGGTDKAARAPPDRAGNDKNNATGERRLYDMTHLCR